MNTQTRLDLEQVQEILEQRIYELTYGEGFEKEEVPTRNGLRYWKSKYALITLLWVARGVRLVI